jgi:phosphoadenosine phosphosulfate reductase
MKRYNFDRYGLYGITKSWLNNYFRYGDQFFKTNYLGPHQITCARSWFKDAGLIGHNSDISLFEHISSLGADSPLVWAILWTNLAYASDIVNWYILHINTNERYFKSEFVSKLGPEYPQASRNNAVTALLDTLKNTPIGKVLKQGIPTPNGKLNHDFDFMKQSWDSPDILAILYSLYKYVIETDEYNITLSELTTINRNNITKGISPALLFGLDKALLKQTIETLTSDYPDYASVTTVKDGDLFISLYSKWSPMDILGLVKKTNISSLKVKTAMRLLKTILLH